MLKMERSRIVEIGVELSKEMSPGDSLTQVMVRQILAEFTIKLADRIVLASPLRQPSRLDLGGTM
jgi:hypothetical protein